MRRGLTAIDAAMLLVIVILIVQMWLLTASLESYLAGHTGVALPAALISGALSTACVALYLFIRKIDRALRKP
jgi:predicted Co/Zn/Cd cation transporter (cation efflux family)